MGSDVLRYINTLFQHNFNPRSPCGERPDVMAGGDKNAYFNPRSPCGERPVRGTLIWLIKLFQSTLPVRGATTAIDGNIKKNAYFNPRSPCGERRPQYKKAEFTSRISIHAPRAGSDIAIFSVNQTMAEFQSTLPVRGATKSILRDG